LTQFIFVSLYFCSILSVPVAYIIDEYTTFCLDTSITSYSARIFQRQPDFFWAYASGSASDLEGTIYYPATLSQHTVHLSYANDTQIVEFHHDGSPWITSYTVQSTSANARELCLWTPLDGNRFDPLDGAWAFEGQEFPVVHYCLGHPTGPQSGYYFVYPNGDQEIGYLTGQFGFDNYVFYGNWTSTYLNCQPSQTTDLALYVVDSSGPLMRHIGESRRGTGPDAFEDYERAGFAAECGTTYLSQYFCPALSTTSATSASSSTKMQMSSPMIYQNTLILNDIIILAIFVGILTFGLVIYHFLCVRPQTTLGRA